MAKKIMEGPSIDTLLFPIEMCWKQTECIVVSKYDWRELSVVDLYRLRSRVLTRLSAFLDSHFGTL